MLRTMRCIRFGEVLLDENLKSFLLCINCHNEYRALDDFRQHLERCQGVEHLFQKNSTLAFDGEKAVDLWGRDADKVKKFLVYNYNDVQVMEAPHAKSCAGNNENYLDLLKIEEELLDPRWYTDAASESELKEVKYNAAESHDYDELVDAVTPFVQFKENVKRKPIQGKVVKSSTPIAKHPNQVNRISTNNDLTKKLLIKHAAQQPLKVATPLKTYAKRKLSVELTAVTINNANTKPAPKQAAPNLQNSKPLKLPPQLVSKAALLNKPENQPSLTNGLNKSMSAPAKTKKHVNFEVQQTPAITKTIVQAQVAPAQQLEHVSSPVAAVSGIKAKPISQLTSAPSVHCEKQKTEQILNKLQTLGLQIKRSNPQQSVNLPDTNGKLSETFELLKKLQSKGMNVKIINKNGEKLTADQQATPTKRLKLDLPTTGAISNNLGNGLVHKPNLTNGILIKKVK